MNSEQKVILGFGILALVLDYDLRCQRNRLMRDAIRHKYQSEIKEYPYINMSED